MIKIDPSKQSNPVQTLFVNSAVLFGIKLFMPLSFFMISVLIARVLGVRAFGIYATIFSYYALFRILSCFGVDSFLLREIPRGPSQTRHYLRHAFLIGAAFSSVNTVLFNAVLFLAGYSEELRLCGFIVSLALLPDSLNRYVEASFTAHHKSWLAFFTVFVREAAKIACAVAALVIYGSLELAMAAITVSYFIGFFANLALLPRVFSGPRPPLERKTFSRMLKVSLWVAFVGGVNSLFLSTDVIVLSKMQGETAVGFYNAAGKFLVLAFLFIDSFGTALFPFLSRMHHESEERFRDLTETAIRWLMAGLFLFIALVFCFSDFWIKLLFGSEFGPSAGLLRVLVWVVLFLGNSYFLGRVLFIANAQKYDFAAVAAACLLNGATSVYCTSRWGALGTASATLGSVAFLFFAHWAIFRLKVFKPDTAKVWLVPAAGGAVLFGIFYLFAGWNVYGAFTAAAGGYTLFLARSGVFKIKGLPV